MDFVVNYFTGAFASDNSIQAVMTLPEARWVVVLYSTVYALVFLVFFALYHHALSDAPRMELNEKEQIITQWAMRSAAVHVVVSTIVVMAALVSPPTWAPLMAFIYFAIGPAGFEIERRKGRALS
ncbi:MAG: hypothetical protein AAF449_24735 [Myxococcota bacterium]